MILYRGSLKSCNYGCSYCPFSKRKMIRKELKQDKRQWERFVESLCKRARVLDIHGLLVAPYGEALIHPWYWEGLARLSALDQIEAVGAQTNLSFSLEWALEIFCGAGGQVDKLRLWATFHPEMISAGAFAAKCTAVQQAGIALCAGAVGVPEDLPAIGQLRAALPEQVYLWINKMDGLGRFYTEEERDAFSKIDPYFIRELMYPVGDASKCRGRLFVEADGRMRACNLSLPYEENWYDWEEGAPAVRCRRRVCSCYLAYGGREDFMNEVLFGRHPLFRNLRRSRAVFLDIDGTLIPKGSAGVPARTAAELAALAADEICLFFATTLPYGEALRRCQGVRHLFRGGVFAGGAHVRLEKDDEVLESFRYLEPDVFSEVERLEGDHRVLAYRNGEGIYKITLLRPRRRPWGEADAGRIWEAVPKRSREGLRYFLEGHCMQIVAADADKAGGVAQICAWIGVSPGEVAAAGDSEEDEGMLRQIDLIKYGGDSRIGI